MTSHRHCKSLKINPRQIKLASNLPKFTRHILFRISVGVILLNLFIIILFINSERSLFNDFVTFGLQGTWNCFTFDIQTSINNVANNYSLLNGPLILFVFAILGNAFLTIILCRKIYMDNMKSGENDQNKE